MILPGKPVGNVWKSSMMSAAWSTVVLVLLLTSTLVQAQAGVLPGKGEFRINGIFPITTTDASQKAITGINYQSGLMLAEAMRFAVERINNVTRYMYGYKLQIYKIYDFPDEGRIRNSVLETFLEDVPFLIGPQSSEATYETSILTGTFRQVAISYGATFIDFDPSATFKHYMLRTVSSDFFRIQATLDLIASLQWNYIAVVSSYGYNGERDARILVDNLPGIGVCLAEQHSLMKGASITDFYDLVQNLLESPRLKAVILMTTPQDSESFLAAIQHMNAESRFLLVFFYGCTNLIEVVQGKETAALGALSIDFKHFEVPEFKEWFLNLNPANRRDSTFRNFWQELFNCSLMEDTLRYARYCSPAFKLEVGKGYYPNTAVLPVIKAVYAVANAIRDLIEFYCAATAGSTNQTECFIDASDRNLYSHAVFINLKRHAFKDGFLNVSTPWQVDNGQSVQYQILNFVRESGKYVSLPVGDWVMSRQEASMLSGLAKTNAGMRLRLNRSDIWWVNGSRETPTALCSEECPAGEIRVKDSNPDKSRCCWSCKKCPPNHISVNGTCLACADVEHTDGSKRRCVLLPASYIQLESNPEVAVFIFLSVVGLILVAFVTVTFIYYNSNRIVRASGRDLCYTILFGLALLFLCPFAFIAKPSVGSCVFRATLPGLAFLICYAPLFLKTNRIYRIFLNAKTSVSRPMLVSPQSQMFILGGIVSIQILLAGVWFVSKLPEPSKVVSPERAYITVHCNGDTSPLLLILNLALSVVFMISCTFLAFKTRHFPKNYNEAKYIGITMYITCVCWAVFLPTYFITPSRNTFLREYLMCTICIVIGMITLFGLFGQKIKILMFPSKSDLAESRPNMLSSISHQKSPSHQDLHGNGEFLSSPSQIRVNMVGLANGNTHTEIERANVSKHHVEFI